MIRQLLRSGRRVVTAAAILAAVPLAAEAQTHRVSGRVTSADLAPLVGATVQVKGTTVRTVTNASGAYTVVAPSPTDVLVFSTLGYVSREEPINSRAVVDATLEAQAVGLAGVVVVGYGTQTRATVSGAVSSVSSEDLERTSGSSTAEALVGKIQGINTRLTTSGAGTTGGRAAVGVDGRPGAATVIQIRNMGSPLFVIDGVPTDEDGFQNLNTSDIETISVLKDASASVYGFRAANGVILVTTKRGRGDKPVFRVDGYTGLQSITRHPYADMANAYEFQYAKIESEQNMPWTLGVVRPQRSIPLATMEKWRAGTEPGYQSFNAYDAVVNNPNAAQYNVNMSLSGSSGDANYYLSFGRISQDYVMKDNNFNRNNLQANVSARLFDRLTLDAKIRARQELTTNFALTGDNDVIRTALLGINSTWPTESPWADPDRKYIAFDFRNLSRNPAAYNKESAGWQDDTSWNFNGTFFAEVALPFSSSIRGSFSRETRLRNFDQHRYSFDAYRYNATTQVYDIVGTSGSRSRYQFRDRGDTDWAQLLVNTRQTVGAHTLAGVFGYEQTGSESWATAVTSVPPGNFTHLISFSDQTGLDNSWNISRRASYIGRLNYDYQQKYLIEGLGRYDGSYLFAPGKRWGFFPGVSAGWRVTEEPFLRERFSWLSELKLRASWGRTGRETGANWAYLGGATFNSGNALLDGVLVTGVKPRNFPTTNLSWVTSTSRNVGVDLQLFRGLLSGEFDVFERRLTGLPATRSDVVIPTEVGYSLPQENLESEATRGIEGILRYTSSYRGLNFSIASNATLARNKILERYMPRYGNSVDRWRTATENRWDGALDGFGYEVLGQFQTVKEIENYPVNFDNQGNRTLLPGDLIYKDQNQDGIINNLDQRPLGFSTGSTPLISYGLNTSLRYGALSLSADFAGGSLYSFIQQNELRIGFFGEHNSQSFHLDRWRRADPYNDQSEWIPGREPPLRKGVNNHSSVGPTSEWWRHNVWYLRLKRVEVAYNVPSSLSSRFGLSPLRVYTSAANPLLFDNLGHIGIDPELVQGNGLNYPTMRVLNVGFSATLGGQSTTPAPVVPVTP